MIHRGDDGIELLWTPKLRKRLRKLKRSRKPPFEWHLWVGDSDATISEEEKVLLGAIEKVVKMQADELADMIKNIRVQTPQKGGQDG